ncbi:hypothetical protein [Trueperella bialowiezensis]|uniref:hypothetical protein n=1 Tax=Trueperella bialowiezensis TaxID=312285 RepID=UPI000F83EE44|nr:hypothetical protein [Trueperella bialowiezensis]
MLRSQAWFHTTHIENWPPRDYDPISQLAPDSIPRLRRQINLDQWAARQKTKALHLGTYESAVHNVYRRIGDQRDGGKPIYLYRVALRDDVVIRPDWVVDPSKFGGDIQADAVCRDPETVARYVNYHEDPGSISLAIRPEAIRAVQELPVLSIPTSDVEINQIVSRLNEATQRPLLPKQMIGRLELKSDRSPVIAEANEIVQEKTEGLPWPLRDHLRHGALESFDEQEPGDWAHWLLTCLSLVYQPARVMDLLNRKPWRIIFETGSGQYPV